MDLKENTYLEFEGQDFLIFMRKNGFWAMSLKEFFELEKELNFKIVVKDRVNDKVRSVHYIVFETVEDKLYFQLRFKP